MFQLLAAPNQYNRNQILITSATKTTSAQTLVSPVQELSKDKDKFNKMSRAYTLFREREPEAFTRAFHRAPSIVGAFIPKGELIVNLGKSCLQQIEEEIEREKAPKTSNKKINSKGD